MAYPPKDHLNYMQHSRGESLPLTGNAVHDSLVLRLQSSNYRLAEAVLAEIAADEGARLEQIRTQCARGNVLEAEKLARLAIEGIGEPTTVAHFDLWIESAKIAYQLGNWPAAISRAERVLRWSSLPAIARITVLQIRCISCFERGEWGRALTDVDSVRSLRLLFPKSQSSFYTEILRIKILTRIQGPTAVEHARRALWTGLRSGELNANLDTLLTLLRLEIDLRRWSNRPTAELAKAAYFIAQAMGDEMYAALALVDLRFSESSALRKIATELLPTIEGRFPKVDLTLAELEKASPTSESARSLHRYAPVLEEDDRHLQTVDFVFFGEPGLRVNLRDLSVNPVDVQSRSRQIIELLAEGPRAKAELFSAVWKIRYKPEQHDIIVRNALTRARKQSGLPFRSQDSQVELVASIVVALEDSRFGRN